MLAEHGQAGPNSCVCRSPIWAALVCSSPARQETGPSISLGGRGVTNPLKEALTALADAVVSLWTIGGRALRPDEAPTSRRASQDRSCLPRASGEARQKAGPGSARRLSARRSRNCQLWNGTGIAIPSVSVIYLLGGSSRRWYRQQLPVVQNVVRQLLPVVCQKTA